MIVDRTRKVYFARCIGPTGEPIGAIKIGCSHGWNERLKNVTTTLPFTLELMGVVPGSFMMENTVHLALKSEKIAGEYFRETDETMNIVRRAASSGVAFHYIRDNGDEEFATGATKAFLDYHGITIPEVAKRLGLSAPLLAKRMEDGAQKNRKVVAAAALIAAGRREFSRWPTDALRGLLGEKSSQARDRAQDEAPAISEQAAA